MIRRLFLKFIVFTDTENTFVNIVKTIHGYTEREIEKRVKM